MARCAESYRVFLFGIDGATWTLLQPWVETGDLPALRRLMAGGAWGPLASTLPALTPVAWTSMVTGVYPGKHGIYGFVKRAPASYDLDIVTARDRRRPALWDMVSQAGMRSIVVDVPFTYPPDPIEGIMVAGLGTPDVTTPFVHPAPLRETLLREFSPYPLDLYFRGDVLQLLDDAHRLTDHRLALTRFLMAEYPWDFFMLGLMATDRLQHVVWRYLDPQHSRYDPDEARRLQPAILAYYRHLDEMVGALYEMQDAGTVFLIASDHGFGPLERSFSLLRWLGQARLVALADFEWQYAPPDRAPVFGTRGSGRVVARTNGAGESVQSGLTFVVDRPDAYAGAVFAISELDPSTRYEVKATITDGTPGALLEFDDLSRKEHPIIGGGYVHAVPGEVSAVFQPVARKTQVMVAMTTYGGNPCGHIAVGRVVVSGREDWSRTKAYVLDTGTATEGRRIRLNVRGREPFGVVEPGEPYERLRAQIAAGLQALRDDMDRPLVGRVYRREELYAGPFADEGPDLVVIYADGVGEIRQAPELLGFSADGPISAPVRQGNSGNHRRDGILLAAGRPIRQGVRLSADIVDLCPTILHFLGVPIPPDTDGRVLTQMLEQAPGAAHTTIGAARRGPADVHQNKPGVYSDAERQQIEDRLRRLGYIE